LNRFAVTDPECKSTGYTWKEAIHPYVKDFAVWKCPSNAKARIDPCCWGSSTIFTSYAVNGSIFDIGARVNARRPSDWFGVLPSRGRTRPRLLGEINRPSEALWVIETGWKYDNCPDNGDWTIADGGPADRHSCGNNWIYCDGHAKWGRVVNTLTP